MRDRHKKDELAVLDAAYWVKGCSSLGRLRYAVLIGIGKHSNFGKFCLVDIKEAVVAAAPRYAKSTMPRDTGKRVVEGARNLSPFLGERMLAARFLDRSIVIRELFSSREPHSSTPPKTRSRSTVWSQFVDNSRWGAHRASGKGPSGKAIRTIGDRGGCPLLDP